MPQGYEFDWVRQIVLLLSSRRRSNRAFDLGRLAPNTEIDPNSNLTARNIGGRVMKTCLALGIATLMALQGVALAQEITITPEEVAGVDEALAAWGCSGGVIDKEPTGVYEVEDADCPMGVFDFHIGADFAVMVIIGH